ncbi:unnamed protein product [Rotaria sordida]|uniref:peptidylprolyl isomerase n=2 Tax=Rotaria sordida TaxID=392033 RepID=A0A815R9B5_9BILA|nr:unnamed protein product [Rotaria sordida]CAF1300605.1 unnamed protein product [Rotaria sordida]CAF1472206.1 unnamed protein product [Rotaria sordida]
MSGKKGKGKGASAEGDSAEVSGGSSKGGTSIKVRHILCEKQSKVLEALEKINSGMKFDEVARILIRKIKLDMEVILAG